MDLELLRIFEALDATDFEVFSFLDMMVFVSGEMENCRVNFWQSVFWKFGG